MFKYNLINNILNKTIFLHHILYLIDYINIIHTNYTKYIKLINIIYI